MEHPDEQLAGYVDGSASPEERRAVDAHLVGCSQCRHELALATKARTALMSVPELEAPGLAAQGIEGLLPGARAHDEVADRREAKREGPQRSRWQVSWPALAGVAAVLVLLAVVPFVLTKGGPERSSGGLSAPQARPTEAANYPAVVDRGFAYDQDSIQALARQLGQDARKETRTSGPLRGGPVETADASSTEVVRCAVEGTGLPADTVPVYLETATYRGTPAFVVAVLAQGGNRDHLRVYAVSRGDCGFLYEADQPL
jgi:anti-sigma factor RsiW